LRLVEFESAEKAHADIVSAFGDAEPGIDAGLSTEVQIVAVEDGLAGNRVLDDGVMSFVSRVA
jgi:hypothetical protein